ncbi:MAG: trypsin-like peptidase domain-containing protein [Firmicutes bacterium]|nr:trypsin-like peptidase domain-containing protein [Bacillota bacterium]
MKKFWLALAAALFMVTAVPGFQGEGRAVQLLSAIRILVDGREVATDIPPTIIDGRTMVPVRFVSEALGAEVQWDAGTRTVRIATPGSAAAVSASSTSTTASPGVSGAGSAVGVNDVTGVSGGSLFFSAVPIIDKVKPSVVGVIAQYVAGNYPGGAGEEEISSGTGVVWDAQGRIVTNNHVVDGASRILVVTPQETILEASLLGSDALSDIALLKIEAPGLTPAVFGNSATLKVGEPVVAIGHPMGFHNSATAGIVSGLDRVPDQGQGYVYGLLQTDAAISPGNSGGPLASSRGEVVGINTLKVISEEAEGLGFAIPSNVVTRVVRDLLAVGNVVRPFLGLELSESELARYVIPRGEGLLVEAATPGLPGYSGGIRAGDRLMTVGGKTTDTLLELSRALDDHRPGDIVKILIRRGKLSLDLQVTLGQRP